MFLNTLHTHQWQTDLVKPARWHRSLSACCTIAYWTKLHIYKEGSPPIINNFAKKSRKRLQSPPLSTKKFPMGKCPPGIHFSYSTPYFRTSVLCTLVLPYLVLPYSRTSVLPYFRTLYFVLSYLRTSVLCTPVLPYFRTSVLPYFRKPPSWFSSYHRCTWSQRCSRHRRPCRSADQPCYSRSRQPPRG